MDFGFVGPAYEAPSLTQDTQELINWYCEIDRTKGPQDRGVIALYPTPGLTAKLQPQVAEVRGLYTLPGGATLLAIVVAGFYSIDSTFTATLRGNLLSSSGPVNITTNGIAAYFCDGTNRYSYTFTGNVFSIVPVTDGAFNGGGRSDIVDNFIIYPRPGTQQWGATSALSVSSPALSFSSKDGAPDNLVAPFVTSRQIYLLGEVTGEVWINAGLFPFPFQRIPGTSFQHGCASAASISRLGNSFAYLSRDDRGQGIVVYMDGYNPTQISTHAVTNDIKDDYIADAIGFTYQIEGHEMYVLTFPTADKTWVYDLSTQYWHKWRWVDEFNVYHRHRANCCAVFQGQVLVGDWENGKIYQVSNTVYTDDGQTIRRLRRTPHVVSDMNQVFFTRLQLQFQPGIGIVSGQGSDPQVMMRMSNDGGNTYGNERWNSIGKAGAYRDRVIWRRLGYARDRVYEVVVTDPIKAVIVSANLVASAGSN